MDGIQQVCFPASVYAQEAVDGGGEVDLHLFQIFELYYLDIFKVHDKDLNGKRTFFVKTNKIRLISLYLRSKVSIFYIIQHGKAEFENSKSESKIFQRKVFILV